MAKAIQAGAPKITPVPPDPSAKTGGKPEWKASEPAVAVKAGEWVTFDSKGVPAKLWFPIEGQVMQATPLDLEAGPVNVRTNPYLKGGVKIPYVFFLTEVGDGGEMLIGNSPPYIKIKDDPGTRSGTGGGNP